MVKLFINLKPFSILLESGFFYI